MSGGFCSVRMAASPDDAVLDFMQSTLRGGDELWRVGQGSAGAGR
jgi:hypothetical protein